MTGHGDACSPRLTPFVIVTHHRRRSASARREATLRGPGGEISSLFLSTHPLRIAAATSVAAESGRSFGCDCTHDKLPAGRESFSIEEPSRARMLTTRCYVRASLPLPLSLSQTTMVANECRMFDTAHMVASAIAPPSHSFLHCSSSRLFITLQHPHHTHCRGNGTQFKSHTPRLSSIFARSAA